MIQALEHPSKVWLYLVHCGKQTKNFKANNKVRVVFLDCGIMCVFIIWQNLG